MRLILSGGRALLTTVLAVAILSTRLAVARLLRTEPGSRSAASKAKVVRAVGTLVALPPIVQAGATPGRRAQRRAGRRHLRAGPTAGRVVLPRASDGARLEQVARKRQDAWGSAAFAAPRRDLPRRAP